MKRADRAAERFDADYNCAQAVLWSFADALGLDPDAALRIASGFGGGIARRQEICGAVSGGIMALGLRFGRGEAGDLEANDEVQLKTVDFIRRFESRHGSVICGQLLEGCDLSTEEGRQACAELGLHERICTPCVRSAVAIVEEMLAEAP